LLVWLGGAGVLGLLWWRWSSLLVSTLSPDLAQAAGLRPDREQLVLTLALAVVVAVAIKVVGALLIAAMLIIPAAAARPLARTPDRMALIASGIGGLSALGGLATAWQFDTPAGPTIVCVATLIFCLSAAFGLMRHRLG
jgi:zinc transport system permease protein